MIADNPSMHDGALEPKALPVGMEIPLLRKATESDRVYIDGLYCLLLLHEYGLMSTSESASISPIDPMMKTLIDLQIEAKRRHYAVEYPEAEVYVIETQQADCVRAVGYLSIQLRNGELLLIDIIIDPRYRRCGLAKRVTSDVISWVRQRKGSTGLPSEEVTRVVAHVFRNNFASAALLSQLGFRSNDGLKDSEARPYMAYVLECS